MISKRKLKERLLDICAGAGMEWDEAGEYFDCRNGQLECMGRLIPAIEHRFSLGDKTRLRSPWRLDSYENIDTISDLVFEALQFDKE